MRRSTRITVIVSAILIHLPDEPPDRDRLPEGRGTPLTWYIGAEPIGWERGVGEGVQYFVLSRSPDGTGESGSIRTRRSQREGRRGRDRLSAAAHPR
ncbi:hypothetical protein [Brevibacterium marinum]|uniref:Uncharacterized protein n=1 Tax=Brevibacterium marinum TaxID=418643 RepID=A0A846RXU2_9MICO|nr:hypothetical protein [Brevibacterium marinum]NJC56766.1 hypothetical protein [Brevibacterium marinum]